MTELLAVLLVLVAVGVGATVFVLGARHRDPPPPIRSTDVAAWGGRGGRDGDQTR